MIPTNAWRDLLSANGLIQGASGQGSGFGRLAVTLIYGGVFLKDVISAWGYPTLTVALLALGVLCAAVALLIDNIGRSALKAEGIIIITASFTVWMIGIALTQTINTSSYFIAPLLAFLVLNTAPKAFLSLLVAHLIISLGVQVAEYLTDSYLFVYEAMDGSELDETLFAGTLGVFRAKGLFQGPLSAVAFAAWMAFLYRGSIQFVVFMLLSAFLAGGRLGIVVAAILIFIRLSAHKDMTNAKRILISAAMLLVGALAILLADSNRLLFISSAFDTESAQNLGRFYFWVTSLNHFLNYDWLNFLFGKFGFIRAEVGGTENDFLRILLDNGATDLFIYLAGLIGVFWAAIRQRNLESFVTFLLIIAMMNIFPFIQSLNSALLFWLFVIIRVRALRGPGRKRKAWTSIKRSSYAH